MLFDKWIGVFFKRGCVPSLRSRFRNELFHPIDDLLWVVLWLNNCLAVFFAYFDLCTGRNVETLSHRLRENDSTFRIHFHHIPTFGGNKYNRFAVHPDAALEYMIGKSQAAINDQLETLIDAGLLARYNGREAKAHPSLR